MKVKEGVKLEGLQPVMRPVLRSAESIWKDMGRSEGVTVTSTTDGVHSAGSWHYYGYAVDFRTRYFSEEEAKAVAVTLEYDLPDYDIVLHSTHIHVEIGNQLAMKLGVYF